MKPLIRNFFENTSTVQLDHRVLATTTLFSIGALWFVTRKLDIHPAIRSLIGSTVGMAALQVTLGISTLLSYVPVSLGSAHQAGALTLLTLMILLNHTPSARNMSMAASVGMENKEGLKLLVLGGPGAQNMVGEPASEYAQPRVSPYRLAAYLTSAFVIYSGLFWTGLSVVMPEPPAESVTWVRGAAKVKKTCHSCVSFIVGITMDFNMNVNACVPTATQYSSVYDIIVNCDYVRVSYPKSRFLRIYDVEATSLFAFKALYEKIEYLDLERIWGYCQNMVPSTDETGLNELKRLLLANFDQLECIIDMTQQQDVTSTAFSNLVDLSLFYVPLREICSGGSPPRGFLENLETLRIKKCNNMNCLFPRMLIQRLGKLKQVAVTYCQELEDVFQLEGLSYAKENPFLLSTLESLYLFYLQNLRYIWKDPIQQVSLQSLTVVQVKWCNGLRYLFTLSLARSLLQLEQLKVWRCSSLEHIVEIEEAEENVAGGGGNDVMFPKLRILQLGGLENFINFYSENYSSTWPALQELSLYLPLSSTLSSVALLEQTTNENLRVLNMGISDESCNTVVAQFRHGLQNLEELEVSRCRVQVLFQLEDVEQELSLPSLKVLYLYWLKELECLCKGPTHLLSMPNLKKLSVIRCNRLRHMFSPSLARNFMQLEELIIKNCGELEQIFIEDDAAEYNQTLLEDHLHWPLLFPNLQFIDIQNCDKLRSMFPVITHLLSLQNLTTLELHLCKRLRHLFSSTLARNLLQLESIFIENCKELEQFIVEDHTEDDHVQFGLFPNLSSISVKGCGKLKTLFPAVTIARSGLQKLRTLYIRGSFQLEELFGHKDEADMTSDDDREMVLPRLEELTLEQLGSLVNFCPVGYHFIFPSLSRLFVTKCPKITTRFSVDQNRSVHAEAKVPQMGKEDADMKRSPRKTTVEIDYRGFYGVESILPPYIGK
ncbi:hypothetical protein LWI28_007920 [Acer negundo]|uniref:Disease resistance protein At4g27190-like leucine-rich repeats domain-containing protein n=1 Tax=Acer negundo TaxID=4023 RepID=A0AAD5J551_ACENE|nr:hypothetical protein LWI28_007920 [Acer negundo]